MKRGVVAAALLTIVFLAACDKSGTTEHSAPAHAAASGAGSTDLPDACSLVTSSEVEAALGKGSRMKSSVNPRTGKHECHFKPAAAGDIDEVILAVDHVYQWDAMKKAMLPPSGNAQPVSGLGDDAFAGRAIGYNVRKGNKYIQVFGSVLNKAEANEKATRYLAQRAAARL